MRIELVTNPTTGSATAIRIDHGGGPSIVHGFAIGTDNTLDITAAVNPVSGSRHRISCNQFQLDTAGSTKRGVDSFFTRVLIEDTAGGIIVGTNGDGVDDLAECNLFAPDGYGIYINANDDNRIAGNYLGVTADGTTPLRNSGVLIRQSSAGNLIGTNEDGVSDERERNFFGSGPASIQLQAGPGATDNRIANSGAFGIWLGDRAPGGRVHRELPHRQHHRARGHV